MANVNASLCCSEASWHASGESPAGGNCPVATVVIPGGGAGDQSVESPGVKVLVGRAQVRSAPTGGRANRQVVANANRSQASKLRSLTRIGGWEDGKRRESHKHS